MEILKDRYALITGASSGLGVDFANILASAGCHLVLVARRENRLLKIQNRIRDKYGVKVEIITMDLAVPNVPQILYNRISDMGMTIDVLINNAGVGVYGYFIETEWEGEKKMLNLDMINLVHLTKLFVKDMVERNFGYILNIASIGAYQPTPYYSTYAAAKSFVLSFSEALNYELRKTNVNVTALSPGVTETEFIETAGQKEMNFYQKMSVMKSYPVALMGIEAMLKGKPSKIAGINNAFSIVVQRLFSRKFITRITNWLMRVES